MIVLSTLRLLRRASLLLALGSLVGQTQTLSPPPRVELERLDLDPAATGSLLVGSGALLPQGGYRLGVALDYERDPLELNVNGERVGDVIRNRWSAHLFGAYSITPRVEIGLQAPIILGQDGSDLTRFGMSSPARGGLGTTYVHGRFSLIRSDEGPLDLAVHLGIGLPGTTSALGSSGGFTVLPRVMASRAFGRLLASGQLSLLFRDAKTVGGQIYGDQMALDASLAWMSRIVRPEITLRMAIPFGGLPVGAELLAGGRYQINRWVDVFLLGGLGLGQLVGVPAYRVLAGLAFGDPKQPSAPVAAVTPPPPLPPPPDPCSPGQAHSPQQCPDLDDDSDGIKNADDKCPLEKGVPEYAGCPIPDRDHDGVPDDKDKCPDQPGPVENQGCPIIDTDGDGVPDNVDNCPKEPGPASNQGCPIAKKQLVIITANRLEITDKIYFDTSKATIQRRSFFLLDQVASVIITHPDLGQVQVEGHTDNKGSSSTNRVLSQARARSVRDYLVKRGVSAAQLLFEGFGPDRPIAPNVNPLGRAKNRRVEFKILGTPGESGAATPAEEVKP